MNDCNFPIILYKPGNNFKNNGVAHGEEFREQIKELFQIRKNLLLEKNPSIKNNIQSLALQQLEETRTFSPDITDEMEGISQGSLLKIEDIVLLNNYTDFRDILLPDEGCSTIQSINSLDSLSGQTWDMHNSAKKFVSIIKQDKQENMPAQIIFSLVGCVGMMGFNSNGLMIGVNNLNTKNARASIVWPSLVRKVLQSRSYDEMESIIKNAPVTSGHNYLISDETQGSHWEVTPVVREKVSSLTKEKGFIFHTNHCIGEKTTIEEDKISSNSTTNERYQILNSLNTDNLDFSSALRVLTGHEGYPKSICSHFESNTQDPSSTCGGALGSFKQNIFRFWRGCPEHDKNFIAYNFKLSEDRRSFLQV